MKSNKQRRAEIMARRHERAELKQVAQCRRARQSLAAQTFTEPWLVALNNSFAVPRLAYSDYSFTCQDCGKPQVWTAARQQWWYEGAGGHVWSRAVRCAPCREAERLRVKLARQASEAGMLRKLARARASSSA